MIFGPLRNLLRGCGVVVAALMLAGPAGADSAPLAPPGYTRAALATGKPIACPPVPQPVSGPLKVGSKYAGSGPARDTVNAEANAAWLSATAAVNAFEADVAHLTDAYMASGDHTDLACVVNIFKIWAEAHALEGAALDYGGKSIRKWALASAAGSYLRLVLTASAPLKGYAADDAAIRAWLARLAATVMSEWDLSAPDAKINNQTYWAGWAVMAASVVTGRNDFYDWAMKAYARGLAQIDADGYLPSELARGTKALAYHNYALQPLTMLAAFAKANGADTVYPGALSRLVSRTVTGLADPSMFAAKAGVAQDVNGLAGPQAMVWLEAYCWHTACSPDLAAKLAASRPLHANRLGGSVTAVFGP